MKTPLFFKTPSIASALLFFAAAGVLTLSSPLSADTQYFLDADTSTAGAQYGSITWNTTNTNWLTAITGGTNTFWGDGALSQAIIGGGGYTTTGGGTITLGDSTGTITLNNLTESSSVTGPYTINEGGTATTLALTGTSTTISNNTTAATNALTLNVLITDTATFIKTASGTVILTQNNTGITGNINIVGSNSTTAAGGTLQIGNGGTTGATGTGTITLGLTGSQTQASTISYDRSDAITVANAISVSSAVDGGIIQNAGTNELTLTGSEVLVGTLTYQIASTLSSTVDAAVTGKITNIGGISKQGAGSLLINNSGNSYSGGTSVGGGTLLTGSANALGTPGTLSVSGGGTLDLDGNGQTVTATTLGSATLGGGTIANTGGGTVTLATAGVTVNGTNNAINSGANVTGAVTMNTGSALAVNGTAGAVTLGGAGTVLNGTGTVGALTLNSGATISPGVTAGTLTGNGGLIFNGGGTLAFNLSTVDNSSTLLDLGLTAFTKGTAGTFDISLTGGSPGTIYDLVDFGSTTFASTDFTEVGSLAGTFQIVGNQLDFDVATVPEPSTWGLMLGGLSLLVVWQRHRRQINAPSDRTRA